MNGKLPSRCDEMGLVHGLEGAYRSIAEQLADVVTLLPAPAMPHGHELGVPVETKVGDATLRFRGGAAPDPPPRGANKCEKGHRWVRSRCERVLHRG